MAQNNAPIRPQAVSIGSQAIPDLLAYCQKHGLSKLFLVADQNTYAALGNKVEANLLEQGSDLISVVFSTDEVIADALQRKTDGLLHRVVVVGCLVQRDREAIIDRLPGIDAIVGVLSGTTIADLAERDRLAQPGGTRYII